MQGVAEVASIGGFVKQYQVELSSTKMRAANVTLMDVMTAVQNANLNVGGKTVEENMPSSSCEALVWSPVRKTWNSSP